MAPLRWKVVLGCSVAFTAFGFLYFGYFCRGPNCAFRKDSSAYKSNYEAYFEGKYIHNDFSIDELDKEYDLDLEDQDVVVFLHIQKTGGTTFGKHLVEDLEVDPPCECHRKKKGGKKRCDCLNKNREVWLFSRYSTGWKCGLHADWTELKECVDSWFQTEQGNRRRRYFYITMLRDPIRRFLSEWIHVSKRGATWKSTALKCNGREATLEEVPFCYKTEDWRDVSLEDFMACKHNLAINRQTRMLANLSKVNCYNLTGMTHAERDQKMLESAKENLKDLAYFGLTEYQNYSQFLFEHTLHMRFLTDFQQYTSTHSTREEYSPEMLKKIAELNHLDIELYQYAKDLFIQRAIEAYKDEGLPVPDQLKRHLEDADGTTYTDAETQDTGEENIPSQENSISTARKNEDLPAGQDVEKVGAQTNDQFTQGVFERDSEQPEFGHNELPNGGSDTFRRGKKEKKKSRKLKKLTDGFDAEQNVNPLSPRLPSTQLSGGESGTERVKVDNMAAHKLLKSGLLKNLPSSDIGNPPLDDPNVHGQRSDQRSDNDLPEEPDQRTVMDRNSVSNLQRRAARFDDNRVDRQRLDAFR